MDGLAWYKIDLHVHSGLSPCALEEMSPHNVLRMAVLEGISLIAITDHNAIANSAVFLKVGALCGVQVICGMEIQAKEEVHVLTLFPGMKELESFYEKVQSCMLPMKNKPKAFGHQYIYDEEDRVVGEHPILVQQAVDLTIKEIYDLVKSGAGLVIPAHITRSYGIVSQLGFLPPDIPFDALEICSPSMQASPLPAIENSDAHSLAELIRERWTFMYAKEATFSELMLCLQAKDGRKVVVSNSCVTFPTTS